MAAQKKESSLPDNAIRICVDSYGDKDISGRMYSGKEAREQGFISMTEFLLKTDELLDERGRPQSFQQKRTFQPDKDGGKRENGLAQTKNTIGEQELMDGRVGQKGRYATYDIMVLSRMHASWQGFVKDSDGVFVGEFESELQLMELLLEHVYKKNKGLDMGQ